MKYQTLDEFKAVAEFFPRGRIIPQRIFKGPRKIKSRVTFGSDSWALPTETGYVVIADCWSQTDAPVKIRNVRNAKFYGSPYTPGGETNWIGSFGGNEIQQLVKLNLHFW
jgi:hypothetical protein